MRALNKSLQEKCSWRSHQEAELRLAGKAGLRVAFPGSLLCNHILVPLNSPQFIEMYDFRLPDVSPVVYEYCGEVSRSETIAGTFVLDIDGAPDEAEVVPIVVKLVSGKQVGRIMVLGREAYNQYGNEIGLSVSSDVEVQMVEPDWMSPGEMHSIYRQATEVIFINTMRVLDAACTGCSCKLVAGSEFRDEPAFPIVNRYLQAVGCEVFNQSGVSVPEASVELALSYRLVGNSTSGLNNALNQVEDVEISFSEYSSGLVEARSQLPDWR